MKRLAALLLALMLVLQAVPPCFAEEGASPPDIAQIAKTNYRKALAHAGRSSFDGFCGRASTSQLWALGIDRLGYSRNGNENYPYYSKLGVTDGGYFTRSLSAGEYSLAEALRALTEDGTRDVGTVLVGFSRTNTSAGAVAGHSCIIYGIQGGAVYSTESFDRPNLPEGAVSICTIDAFAAEYTSWAVFQGLVEFVPADDFALQNSTCFYVQNRASRPMVSAEGQFIRTVPVGENLLVTGIRGTDYQVDDGLHRGYIGSNDTHFLFFDYSGAGASVPRFSTYLRQGAPWNLNGTVYSRSGRLEAVCVTVEKKNAGRVFRWRIPTEKNYLDLRKSGLREDLNRALHKKGFYTVTIQVLVSLPYLNGDNLCAVRRCLTVWQTTVGVSDKQGRIAKLPGLSASALGWTLENGKWHYSQNGRQVIGWLKSGDTRYYLTESGALTGWHTVDGQLYCFTKTGATQSGWAPCPDGLRFLNNGGIYLTGEQTFGEKNYIFDDNGLVFRNRWRTTEDGKLYYSDDGTTLAGWQKLPDGGTYLFREDGVCVAELVTVEKKTGTGKKAKKEKLTYVKSLSSGTPVSAETVNPGTLLP